MKTIVWFGFVLGAVSAAGSVIYTTAQSKVTLNCGVKSFRRSLVWYHGGEMVVRIDGRSGIQRRGMTDVASRARAKQDTKLEISGVRQEDAGTFTCEVDGTNHEHTLAVVSVSASPTDEVELGTSVTLQCRVNGQSPGSTVQWMRPDGTTAAGTESGTVELRSVASSDAGTWKCVINPDGLTVDLKLKVKVIYTTPQSSVTLDCGVRSFSTSLVWYHGGEMVLSIDTRNGIQRRGETDIASRARAKQDIKLEISGVTQEDAGTFTCEADGTKHEHTLAVVSVSASPTDEVELGTSVTLQCRVKGQTPGSTVQWMRPDGTTAAGTESGTVELRSVASSDAGTWRCVIKPDEHTVDLKLKVKEPTPVAATTARSRKPHNNINNNKNKGSPKPACTNCDTKSLLDLKLYWWVWVTISCGLLIVLLLVIFVIIMCKKIRNKRRRLKLKNMLKAPKRYCQCNRPAAAARAQQGRRKEKPSTLHVQPLLNE
ncbi:CD4-2 molecule, tandem duplicate 2 isoform X2 [Betta splendens]|uniref:CD4-2 molecule, tandem duplicate 2 isoform X2 n=1 Tax=Betta splendens TaxID=158456 RepID=A0A6P7KTD4_BETSP|nr:CD4-2 molecule, tandem duplicate 2 isoform X2 [Betta splendens]